MNTMICERNICSAKFSFETFTKTIDHSHNNKIYKDEDKRVTQRVSHVDINLFFVCLRLAFLSFVCAVNRFVFLKIIPEVPKNGDDF
jgi:hypothetical protein